MPNVLLGVTGSVAAVRTLALHDLLRQRGFDVKIVATKAATYFFDPASIGSVVILDQNEWPKPRYERDAPVLHIELRRWADLLLIAPLDANTLAKLVNGLSDNCLTCVWRAWDPARPVVLAPAMNTLMWQHPLTRRHLRQLAADAGAAHIPGHLDEACIVDLINERCTKLHIVPPQIKELACGDIGIGAMAAIEAIASAVVDKLAAKSGRKKWNADDADS